MEQILAEERSRHRIEVAELEGIQAQMMKDMDAKDARIAEQAQMIQDMDTKDARIAELEAELIKTSPGSDKRGTRSAFAFTHETNTAESAITEDVKLLTDELVRYKGEFEIQNEKIADMEGALQELEVSPTFFSVFLRNLHAF